MAWGDEPGYRTEEREGAWFSLSAAVMPPDDADDWLDIYRHQGGGMVLVGRARGLPAAIAWARERLGIEADAWRPMASD